MIYRVTVHETRSLRQEDTIWWKECLYCGTDRKDARMAFLRSEAEDYGGGGCTSVRKTCCEAFDVGGDLCDTTPVGVGMGCE